MRTWHDRFHADGIWSEVAALLTRAVRRRRGRLLSLDVILDSSTLTRSQRIPFMEA